MTAFYNEMDPYAAQWLENLIAAGHIAPGVVDRRPIQQIEAWELAGFTQCHFFAGIGVWSHALRRAGWSDDRPIWTGSCPCQPFSNAGQQKGFDDERHLWPVWFNLIRQCRPATVVGEQVASALDWLDLVSTDLEASDYAFGASDLCAAGFGGAHIRQRLYFVALAHHHHPRLEGWSGVSERAAEFVARAGSVVGGLADASPEFDDGSRIAGKGRRAEYPDSGAISGMANDDDERQSAATVRELRHDEHNPQSCGGDIRLADTIECPDLGSFTQPEQWELSQGNGAIGSGRHHTHAPMLGRNPTDWLYCRDGKWRPVEPGTFPLAHEAPARVGRLRAYGNALDAETATEFCGTVKEICNDLRPVMEYDL